MINMNKLVLNDKPYSLEYFKGLPSDNPLYPEMAVMPITVENVTYSFLLCYIPTLNFKPSKVHIDGIVYHCNKQFYKASEASLIIGHSMFEQ